MGEAAESKQMLAHDAEGGERGEGSVGEAAERRQGLAHDADWGRERGREVRGRLRETCVEAAREQTLGESTRFCAV